MIDGILDASIDRAHADMGIDLPDDRARDYIKLAMEVAVGIVMRRADGRQLTIAHLVLASDAISRMLQLAGLEPRQVPALEKDLMVKLVEVWSA